jgi:hypothetical protein
MSEIGWLFLVLGLLALLVAWRGWSESPLVDRLDWLDVHRLLDHSRIAGGRSRYYRTIGWTFLALGLLLLIRALVAGEG